MDNKCKEGVLQHQTALQMVRHYNKKEQISLSFYIPSGRMLRGHKRNLLCQWALKDLQFLYLAVILYPNMVISCPHGLVENLKQQMLTPGGCECCFVLTLQFILYPMPLYCLCLASRAPFSFKTRKSNDLCVPQVLANNINPISELQYKNSGVCLDLMS